MRDPALLAVKRPATPLYWRSFRLDPLKPPLDAVDPSEKRGRALVCCGVELPDLPGGLGQVGVIQLHRHVVFFGLRKESAEPQRLLEEGESRIEWALPVSNSQRNLPSKPGTNMVVAAPTKGVETQRLHSFAGDGNDD